VEALIPTIICLAVGIVLLLVELVVPGFGVSGILGLIALVAAVILQIGNPTGMMFVIAIALFVVAAVVLIIYRSVIKGRLGRSRIILQEQIDGESNELSDAQQQALVGKSGVTLSPLRPSGIALVDGRRLNVMTDGEFVDKDMPVTVVQSAGLRILVRAAQAEQETTDPE
jgi:membrane-bound serine protease (ClpP class)